MRTLSYAALGPDSALGPTLVRKREKCETATLLLLLTPPRLVPSPGTPTERQRGAVRARQNAENAVTAMHFLKSGRCKSHAQLLPHAYAWGAALGVATTIITDTYDAAPCVTNDVPKCRAWRGGLWPKAWPSTRTHGVKL